MKIISRKAAIAAGLNYYYTGKLCKYGHDEIRRVSSFVCLECEKTHKERFKKSNPSYFRYKGMIARCTNEEHHSYDAYGKRGITVCDRWLDPENGYDNFVSDMGDPPEGYTLDRVNYNGPYSPENCRWADSVTQEFNKRWTRIKPEHLTTIFEMIDAGIRDSVISKRFNCQQGSILNVKRQRDRYIAAGFDCRPKAAA